MAGFARPCIYFKEDSIMDAYIKDKTPLGNNHNRFGKAFPKTETRICIREYFGCDEEKEKYIAEKLSHDGNLEFRLVKPAGETGRQVVEIIEAKVFEEKKQATIKLDQDKEEEKPAQRRGRRR
jgi:hypothetical protein